MSRTKRDKRHYIKGLKYKEKEALRMLRYYEILENMVKNDDEGKTPRMFSYKKARLVDWLKENKDMNLEIKNELEEIRKKLKEC